jgi:hypothetical protein
VRDDLLVLIGEQRGLRSKERPPDVPKSFAEWITSQLDDVAERALHRSAGGELADIDISTTNVAGVGGFIDRASDTVLLLTQADIGGGSAFTLSARAGIES